VVTDCNSLSFSPAFQCPFPDCGRRFSVMSNMRRHARVHTNALIDTPTEGDGPHQPGASGANPDTSSKEMSLSRGSGRRAGLRRGNISSRGRSSSFSGPGSPIDIDAEMTEEEVGRTFSTFSSSRPGRSAHSPPIAHTPPYGASSILHTGNVHPSISVVGPSLRSHTGRHATQPRHSAHHDPSVQRNRPQSSDSE
jgi:hypothetical protein